MRIIDADAVLDILRNFDRQHADLDNGSEDFVYGVETAIEVIEVAPTIDIVRCGECEYCRRGLTKEMPTGLEVVQWRPFPLIKPGITNKEYLVAIEGGGTDTLCWNGSHWVTENYFIKTDSVIAWTNLLSPYKPRKEKTNEV